MEIDVTGRVEVSPTDHEIGTRIDTERHSKDVDESNDRRSCRCSERIAPSRSLSVSRSSTASPISMSTAAASWPIIDKEPAVSTVTVAAFHRRWNTVRESMTVWIR